MNQKWLDKSISPFSKIDPNSVFENIIEASKYFVPSLKDAKLEGFLHGPRMVLAHKDSTDERPSIVNVMQPNYLTVFSGKIDHSIGVAEEVVSHFQNITGH